MTLGAYGALSVGALSAILRLSHSATVRLADDLAVAGLVARAPSPFDRRQVLLGLTTEGTKRRRAVLDARGRVLADAMAALGPDRRTALADVLEPLLEHLTPGRAEADHICRLCDEDVCPGERCPVERAALRYEGRAP